MRRETCNKLYERALGIAAEMIFGVRTCRGQAEVPLPPIVGNGMTVSIKPKIIEAESPTARPANNDDYGVGKGLA